MSINMNAAPAPALAPKKIAAVNAAMQLWLERQTANNEFETGWASPGARFGGGLVNIDSTEEVEIVIYG